AVLAQQLGRPRLTGQPVVEGEHHDRTGGRFSGGFRSALSRGFRSALSGGFRGTGRVIRPAGVDGTGSAGNDRGERSGDDAADYRRQHGERQEWHFLTIGEK